MSLRFRLLASIVAVLFAALTIGGLLACGQARNSVQTETSAALVGATRDVSQSLALRGGPANSSYIGALVRSFDGQRHVQAILLVDGRERARSWLAPPSAAVPDWFAALIGVPSRAVRIPLLTQFPDVSSATLLLRTEPGDEIGEVWNQTRDAFAVMALFCSGTFFIVYVLIGHALTSLPGLQTGLRSISDGDYETAIQERGPPEFRALARGFNQMAVRLGTYAKHNSQLQEQLVRLQEEERAWIARDLHDEVGPYLFAIGVDADAIPILVDAQNTFETAKRVDAIREAVGHIQKHIRAILRQLRPIERLDFGLDAAIGDAIAFWQRRYPEIRFDLDMRLDGVEIERDVEEVVYRVVRESISNAVRHGRPQLIGVSIICSELRGLVVEILDNGDGLPAAPLRSGMGLEGMSAQIKELNGTFEVGQRAAGRGVRVIAILPLQNSLSRRQAVA